MRLWRDTVYYYKYISFQEEQAMDLKDMEKSTPGEPGYTSSSQLGLFYLIYDARGLASVYEIKISPKCREYSTNVATNYSVRSAT